MTPWWGRRALPVGQRGRVRLGPLELVLDHRAREWRVSETHHADYLLSGVEFDLPSDAALSGRVTRHATLDADTAFELRPALPPAPIVARPYTLIEVPGGADVVLYLSIPVWVELLVGGRGLLLTSYPSVPLPETWFGNRTWEGELALALRTSASTDPDELPLRPHRALAAVEIRNRDAAKLTIDRLRLPTAVLGLYMAEEGLRTPRTRLTRQGALLVDAEVRAPPRDWGAPVVAPRGALNRGIARVLGQFFR